MYTSSVEIRAPIERCQFHVSVPESDRKIDKLKNQSNCRQQYKENGRHVESKLVAARSKQNTTSSGGSDAKSFSL
ncbi:hypothetical protein EVAR_54830_1 [Eumeta japonica]|uniref:Uncharacterized protein n=1 Tax=Eumeta variegata TaxID=151549 RepID=A0A4C1ZGH7_EUMVA|nr:hypothetical protein EVAR_54830_1 [Eumeta japonica]